MGMNEGEQIDDREHRNNQHPNASPVPALPEKPQHYITNHDDKSVCYKGRNEKRLIHVRLANAVRFKIPIATVVANMNRGRMTVESKRFRNQNE